MSINKLSTDINIENIKGKINLGLCCINTQLRKQKTPIFNSRTCIRANYTVEKAQQLALQNVKDLIPMLKYNDQHNIRCFRLTSNFFPHATDPEVEPACFRLTNPYLKEAGDLAREYGIRLLMHPGQYNQVGAKSKDVFDKTCWDLEVHADILDSMGVDNNGVLIVHGGGTYGDKETTKQRWVEQFFKLPGNVQKRLVLENCEKCYSLDDVLDISQRVKNSGGDLPVVFDSHHYECYDLLHPDDLQSSLKTLLPRVVESWGERRPVMHVSNQGEGKVGHHSDYIYSLPDCFLYVANELETSFDLEVEAKAKEQAIFSLRETYPKLF